MDGCGDDDDDGGHGGGVSRREGLLRFVSTLLIHLLFFWGTTRHFVHVDWSR